MQPIQIVLLPGLDGTGVLFQPLLQALPSGIPPIVIKYPTDDCLGYDELLPIVLKDLPQDAPFVILGESFGGPLSLRVAATRPAGLKALILCASFISCPYRIVPRWAAQLVCDAPFRAFPKFAQIKALLGGYSTTELRALSKKALSLVQAKVLAHRVREIIKINVASELIACDLPILYIQGQYDGIVPASNVQRILKLKPSVQVVRIPAPHLVLQTQAAQAASAIYDFVIGSIPAS